jgi:GntR family transcriptional regulator, transcriptional repressor for pyruvate dehydrogenase complex
MQPEEVILLNLIAADAGPLGARRAASELQRAGHHLSESTVSRLLTRLDESGLTERIDRKGRRLTDAGRRQIASLAGEQRLRETWQQASDVTNLGDLLDLLYVRRAVEREAARAAALRATPADVERLRRALAIHDEKVLRGEPARDRALSFHRLIAEISGNRLLLATSEIIFAPALDRTEAVLDVVVGSHSSEAHSVDEHEAILDAIADRDAERAEAAMVSHLDRLIAETTQFSESASGAEIVERLLLLMRTDVPTP